MADDSIDDIDFDDSGDEQADIEYEDSPPPKMSASNASPHFSPGFRIQVHL